MKILAVADFHGQPSAEKNLSEFLKRSYDCIALIGDFTNFGPADLVESILEEVKATGLPTLAVPGNCDPKQILQVLDEYGVNLHCGYRKVGDIYFIGLGGSNLTPFNTPFELTEAEIQEELTALARSSGEKFVLLTHAPPHGTRVDQLPDGTHAGSRSIRQFIEREQPLVALSGHIHEARDVDKLGQTILINPGPLSKGYGAEVSINLSSGIQAKLLEL